MLKFRKADALNDLELFLREVGDEPIRWLERESLSWGEISYADLEAAILAGRLDELVDWRERYSKVVNEKMSPLWILAMREAAQLSTRGKIVFDDSDVRVKEFLRTRAAEFVRELSEENRRALANVILFGQSQRLAPKEIAQLVRPLIGLNSRQSQANVAYRQKLFRQLTEAGLSTDAANSRADKAAIRYASKQHRFRAESIVHTELARAYNRGAFDGIRAAVDAKLMNHCAPMSKAFSCRCFIRDAGAR